MGTVNKNQSTENEPRATTMAKEVAASGSHALAAYRTENPVEAPTGPGIDLGRIGG
jgi:hypothetical protein